MAATCWDQKKRCWLVISRGRGQVSRVAATTNPGPPTPTLKPNTLDAKSQAPHPTPWTLNSLSPTYCKAFLTSCRSSCWTWTALLSAAWPVRTWSRFQSRPPSESKADSRASYQECSGMTARTFKLHYAGDHCILQFPSRARARARAAARSLARSLSLSLSLRGEPVGQGRCLMPS